MNLLEGSIDVACEHTEKNTTIVVLCVLEENIREYST